MPDVLQHPDNLSKPPKNGMIVPFFGVLLPVLLLAAFLRFYRLGYQSFWNDEGNSARLAERSIRLIVEGAAGDIHPPGYYLALKVWRGLLGESEWALRSFSAFAGLIALALIIRLGREYFDGPAAWIAGLFAAIHPFLIYYSQEARMYMPLTALACASFLLTSLYLHFPTAEHAECTEKSRWSLAMLLILVSAAGLYTHYAFVFVILAENLYVVAHLALRRVRPRAGRDAPPTRWLLAGRDVPATPMLSPVTRHPLLVTEPALSSPKGHSSLATRILVHWLVIQAIVLLLFLPWLPTAIRQIGIWPGGQETIHFFDALSGALGWVTFGPNYRYLPAVLSVIAGTLLAGMGIGRSGERLAPAIWVALPTGLILGLGLFDEAFAKFLIVAVPALCLLWGNGAAAILIPPGKSSEIGHETSFRVQFREKRSLASTLSASARPLLILGLIVLSVVGSSSVLIQQYTNPATFRDDYRSIVRRIEAEARPGDAIILNAPNQWEVFTYYQRSGAPVYPLPAARPLVPDQTVAELEDIAQDYRRLFVLFWGDSQADPERVIERWLSANTFKVSEEWVGRVRSVVYAAPSGLDEYSTRPLGAVFGSSLRLESAALLEESSFRPGEVLTLTLNWTLIHPDPQPYKVFLHLATDPGLPPAAQQDSEPGGGLSPTSAWIPGQVYADNHGLLIPEDLPPGEYQLLVGLYNPVNGERLPLTAGGTGDALLLQTINLE